MSELTRARMSFANDIRGTLPKSLGSTLAKIFARNRPLLDFSSGDLPKCINGRRFPTVEEAMRQFNGAAMAYDHPYYEEAQEAAWRYITGLDVRRMEKERGRVHVIPGISGFMKTAVRISAQALLQDDWQTSPPLFVIIPPTHPHWIAAIVDYFGYSAIRTIKRTADGMPDAEDMDRVFREIDRPFVVIASPDENPSGICTPNSFYHNEARTGLLDKIRNHTRWGIFIFDAIYMDLAWGNNAGKRHDLVKIGEELGVRTIMVHSLSKLFMKPGLRIGGAAYVGPLDNIGAELLRGLRREVDGNIKNGIAGPSLMALIEAYSGNEVIAQECRQIVAEVKERVERNEGILNSGPMSKFYPDAAIEAAFYGLHTLASDGKQLPWANPEYQQWLIDLIESRLDLGDIDTRMAWADFRLIVGQMGMSGSHAFATELVMNGLKVLSEDPFYPLFVDDGLKNAYARPTADRVAIRTILAYDEGPTREAKEIIDRVWHERISEYAAGKWRSAYQ